jgi:uncharacterized protein YcbK (DUF882 family)
MKMMKKILALVLALVTLLTVTVVPASAAAVLRYGSRGTEVKALQSALNAVADENLTVDGIFGKATQSAVKRFQRANGLTADGVVGRKTWNALEDALDALESAAEETADSLFASTTSKVITYSLKKSGKVKLSDNFKVREFACNDGSNTVLVDRKLVALLQDIRDHFGASVYINSAYRTSSYNRKVGGSTNSYHVKGMAADIWVKGVAPEEVAAYAESLGVKGIGLYDTFVHVDTRTSKFYWIGSEQTPVSTFR